MMRNGTARRARLAAATWLALAMMPALGSAATYAYSLADFTGVVPYSNAHVLVDRTQHEVYALHANEVRIFSETGMELYRFVAAPELGMVIDLAVDRNGDLIVLSLTGTGSVVSREWALTRCDYRGRPLDRLSVSEWPAPYDDLAIDRVFVRGDHLVLVSTGSMAAVETTTAGDFLRGWDLGKLIAVPPEKRDVVRIGGLNLDEDGSFLLTVPVMFKAYRISPEGEVRGFGKGGQAPGLFGIPSGIAGAGGRVYVADKLRHVVLAFDEELSFVEEFGYFGERPGNLKGPSKLAVDGKGRVYVAQRGDRGVSVFTVAVD